MLTLFQENMYIWGAGKLVSYFPRELLLVVSSKVDAGGHENDYMWVFMCKGGAGKIGCTLWSYLYCISLLSIVAQIRLPYLFEC